jgi:hypothetical protein
MKPLLYAQLAKAAYSTKPTFGKADSASRAVMTTNEDGLCIGFPGTDNPECFESDFNVLLHSHEILGDIHKGFWQALDIIYPVLSIVRPDIIYGHSLGAALSLLYAARLCTLNHPPKAVFAFEPPRISIDNKIARILEDNKVNLYLYRNGKDIVTEIPIEIPFIEEWQHPSELIQIGVASQSFSNIDDHMIDKVIKSLSM